MILLLTLGFGCAKKQEDAAQMEQEMLGGDSLVDSAALADSIPDSTAMLDAQAVPEEPAHQMPAQPPGEGYTVQVASCPDQDYADYLITKFTNRGYEPYVKMITFEGETYYRIRIGVFENFSEAKNLKNELEDKYSAPVWIDVTQPEF